MGSGWIAGTICALSFAAPAAAQSGEISLAPIYDDEAIAALPFSQRFPALLRQGRYLDAIELIETANPDEVDEGSRSYYRQMRPALDGFFYRDPAAPSLPPPDPAELAAYDDAVAEDAIRTIVERARDRRIVIVNEAHDSPRDRAFVLKVAEALRPLGFTHFAAEAFVNVTPEIAATEMGWLRSAGYPRWTPAPSRERRCSAIWSAEQ